MKEKLTERLINSLEKTGKRYDIRDVIQPGFMVRVGASGSKAYYLDYRDEAGTRSKYRIADVDTISLSDARDIARKKAGEVALGKNLNRDKQEKREKAAAEKSQKLGSFIDNEFKPWRCAERKRADEDLRRLKLHFEKWYKLSLSDITHKRLMDWRQERLSSGISPRTINKDIAILLSVMSHAVRVGVIEKNPLNGWSQLKVDMRAKVRFLSQEEELALRQFLEERESDAIEGRESYNQWRSERGKELLPLLTDEMFSDHLYPLVILAIHTGCRPEELLRLEWHDVDLRHKSVTVRGEISKSGRTRHVPLSSEAVDTIKRWKNSPGSKSSGLVFPGKKGQVMDRMPRAVTRAIRSAGIENFRPYDFRHTFASRLALGGVDLNTIRELMGHEDIAMTLIYAHLTHDHRKEAISSVFG